MTRTREEEVMANQSSNHVVQLLSTRIFCADGGRAEDTDVVFEARPWPQGASMPFFGLGLVIYSLGFGLTGLVIGLTLALTAALTIFFLTLPSN